MNVSTVSNNQKTSLRTNVNVRTVINKQTNLDMKKYFCWHLESH